MWAESQRRAHEQHWPAVERLLAAVPGPLGRGAKLLEYDLPLRYSDSGQLRDCFLGPDQFPMLSVGTWLLHDMGWPPGPQREAAERGLFVAALLMALRAHVLDALDDPSSFAGDGDFLLADYVGRRADQALRRLIPSSSRLWDEQERLLDDDLAQRAAARDRTTRREAVPEDPEALLRGRWSGPAGVIAMAAAAIAERDPAGPAAARMCGRLAAAFQVREDVQGLQRDLRLGRVTYPIAIVARAAGVDLDAPSGPTEVLGALILTGSLAVIFERAEELAEEARTAARAHGLETLAGYLDEAVSGFAADARRARRGAGDGADEEARPRRPIVRVAAVTTTTAIDMAARHLGADGTFRESWEMHREGMFGAPEVASRYPAGLVLEILERRGSDVSQEIDRFLDFTVENAFRYYDHPWSDPDSDTLGVFLRLRAQSARPNVHEAEVTRLLDCVAAHVARGDGLGVWIRDCPPPRDDRPSILALGEGCATVGAHLLLGVLARSSGYRPDVLDAGSAHLLERVGAVGVGANVNYPPLYSIAILFRLIGRLPDTSTAHREARDRLTADLEERVAALPPTAQSAALATLACREAERPDLAGTEWQRTILRGQRSDGSWPGEPFAAAPNRGAWVSWYSSSTLTSALCYDALAGYSAP